ncbi:hypothetical protein IKF25_04020 [Candidatus Saccharibacteria bacterium]|nr:hypothetical protein [Candidatus Saccharibacteria bacterium]
MAKQEYFISEFYEKKCSDFETGEIINLTDINPMPEFEEEVTTIRIPRSAFYNYERYCFRATVRSSHGDYSSVILIEDASLYLPDSLSAAVDQNNMFSIALSFRTQEKNFATIYVLFPEDEGLIHFARNHWESLGPSSSISFLSWTDRDKGLLYEYFVEYNGCGMSESFKCTPIGHPGSFRFNDCLGIDWLVTALNKRSNLNREIEAKERAEKLQREKDELEHYRKLEEEEERKRRETLNNLEDECE